MTLTAIVEWCTKHKDLIVVAGVILGAGSLFVAALTYRRNGLIEEDRWRSHLAVQAVALDAQVAFAESVQPSVTMVAEVHRPGAPVTPPDPHPRDATVALQPLTMTAAVAGGASSKETIHLMFRNASFRPAAVVRVFLRDKAGQPVGPPWRKNMDRLHLPLAIQPWQIATLSLDVDGPDFQQAADVVLGDGDDREVAIPLRDRARWAKWIDF